MKLLKDHKLFFLLHLCFISCAKDASVEPIVNVEKVIRFNVLVNTLNPLQNDSVTYINNQNLEIDWGMIILPKSYNNSGKATKLIIGCHGGGGSVSQNGSQTENMELYQYLVSLGYAVMDMAGMPETYAKRLKIDKNRVAGSFIAIDSYEKGYNYVINNFNLDKSGCFILGGSNGGLTAINLAYHSSIPCIAQALFSPVVSIKENLWKISLGAFSGGEFDQFQNRANVIRIYGMKDVNTVEQLKVAFYEEEKVGKYDAYFFKTKYENGVMIKEYPCPIKVWHPKNDPIASPTLSNNFCSAINLGGGKAFYMEMLDGGHVPENYGENIGEFEFHGKIGYVKPLAYEIAAWLSDFSSILPNH